MLTISRNNILLDSNQPADTTIKNQSLYVVRTDQAGRLTHLNRLFCESTGISDQDYLGKPYIDLVLPEDRDRCNDTFKACLEAPGEPQRVLLRKRGPKGIGSTQWEFICLDKEEDSTREVLCLGHDVTQLVKKQENLENLVKITSRQNERLKEFTYIISHNIRSHVANLSGIINGIDRDDPADVDYSLELLKVSVGALDSTIQHLNDIITIQQDIKVPLKSLKLKSEILKTARLLQQQISDASAELKVEVDAEERLTTNPAYLESILLNLISNALKYRHPERQAVITVSIENEKDFRILRVSDNGLGIDLERNGAKLFKMFSTFHGNRDARGVGLFIVKTQVEALGGKIEVDCEPKKGCIFSVYFKAE
ncbi:PAS domain S-box-containing protein [Mucilaginibacter pineti]|uniref:histidine kinase n=1 Tax=Mucilaginibacter pineti TaxID=1391627 RepID=A0A1G7JUQ0_9SPHI|nr:ATP-binding protein [Mucilaginibacter pineti]SDF28648.1 PAS domain S-box-containing protein [Mucilaginibacter pineti]